MQYESDYATMKFKKDPVPLSERPRAQTASLYAPSSQTPLLDQLHKNDLLHRSMTALQEYRDSFELQQRGSAADGSAVDGGPAASEKVSVTLVWGVSSPSRAILYMDIGHSKCSR